jgi:site-specific recombinase XerD
MDTAIHDQGTIEKLAQNEYLPTVFEAFLIDRRVQNMAAGTLSFYQKKLNLFQRFADSQAVTSMRELSPGVVRAYLIWLEDFGHNPGGVHACYRTLKTAFRWWLDEFEPDNVTDPFKRVKAPKIPVQPLEPIENDDIESLLKTCGADFTGRRDAAFFLFLADTGARAAEALAVNLKDVDFMTGDITIRQGKGRKPRSVFLGKRARKALRQYLKHHNGGAALWLTDDGERLTYWGVKSMTRRRAKAAGIETPQLHAFRRSFALAMLRNGADLISIQKLMGHADLQVLTRYLKQNNADLRAVHAKNSPADML